ncbi:DUF438 domain-containing protein [Eubacterium sp. MSJ-33]|uniref:DUF438 domain-containing protein n=1 Tax=Eubacterium sp. MSJ-33 TaxID=2841528 RepID=UPI001C748E32|nr:DUF438 domain-containing protein [Eubacterium sp. MSJ-33]QWT53090.1 DUF438 domain-containing protein [Eubacterium sp. MSJ-33]
MKDRIETLKEYLKRLGDGEPLEAVRKDFVEVFKDVDPAEIMKAEQEMLAEGTPLSDVQKLCDVHAALFHGKTREEQIANAEKAVHASVLREERETKTRELAQTKGHPLWLFANENGALAMLLEQAEEKIKDGSANKKTLESLRGLSIHYAKKGDLLYPVLNVRYGISGPASVMWTVDDEIRDEISFLAKMNDKESEWQERFATVVARAQEMIYKEANILFPNCAANFTEEEWIGIYHDQKDYAVCFGVEPEIWQQAEECKSGTEIVLSDAEIRMPGGHLTIEQLTAMLNTMPMEITFVDENNLNRFFNEGPKDFKRPGMAIGREVFSCHPPKIEVKVRRIIEEFRAGTLDEVPVWMDKNGKCMLVRYMAVRDKAGKYLGTLELVQDMGFAKEYFQKKEEKAELW